MLLCRRRTPTLLARADAARTYRYPAPQARHKVTVVTDIDCPGRVVLGQKKPAALLLAIGAGTPPAR